MEHVTTLDMGDSFTVTLDPAGLVNTTAAQEANAAGPVWVLDRLTLEWSAPEYPAQPEPVVCTFALLAEDPDALPPLEVGTVVHAETRGYFNSYESVVVGSFYGRISDAVASAVTFRGQAMVAVEVTAVDHTAGWREIVVGAQPFPVEPGYARLQRVLDLAGLTEAFTWGGGSYAAAVFRALDVDSRPWLDLMDEHLAQVTDLDLLNTSSTVYGWERGVCTPALSTAGEVQVRVDGLRERGGTGPRVFTEVGGLLVSMADDTIPTTAYPTGDGVQGVATVSAAYCAATLTWRRDKGKLPNRALVAGEFLTAEGATVTTVELAHDDLVAVQGPITRRLDATLRDEADALDMAGMYLPDRAEYVGRWATESVTVYAAALEDFHTARALLEAPPLFPWHGTDNIYNTGAGHPFGATLHVHGLQVGHRLGGYGYVAGTILGSRLEVRANAPVADRLLLTVTLAPEVRRPAYAATAPASDLPALPATPQTLKWHHPTVTVRDAGAGAPYLDPTLTVYDTRLIRNEEGTL